MKEDVLELILNLKTLNFAVDSDEPVEIKLKVFRTDGCQSLRSGSPRKCHTGQSQTRFSVT